MTKNLDSVYRLALSTKISPVYWEDRLLIKCGIKDNIVYSYKSAIEFIKKFVLSPSPIEKWWKNEEDKIL